MLKTTFAICTALVLSACAQTTVQQMSRDTFKVDTSAAPACGPSGARNVAFKAAAIEVIRKGGDKFILADDRTDMDGWSGTHAQGMIVKMIPEGSREAGNALSARQTLGGNWQEIVQKGVPMTCS